MKISTDSIQGFAEMSDTDKVTALLGIDVPDPVDLSGYVKKEVFDAKATEAANLSKQLKSKLTDDEAAKAQADADRKALEEKYTELLRKSTIAEHTARYIAMPGYALFRRPAPRRMQVRSFPRPPVLLTRAVQMEAILRLRPSKSLLPAPTLRLHLLATA